MYQTMTPGPTNVRENVRMARSLPTTNPDLDEGFFDFYRETCRKLSRLMHTENQAYILGGEGILGLETACATLTEPGDRVLVIENGVFGRGFADFVRMYGGDVVEFSSALERPVPVAELKAFLESDSDFKYATVVHCDTPSGVLNDIQSICTLLAEYGILTVVDSVAGMFGEYVNVNKSHIDVLLGGSQKALSAPPGLTMMWVSNHAMTVMENRKTPVASFYANLLNFKDYYEHKEFPYTMPISDIYGLNVAIDNVLADKDILDRHARIAHATRVAVTAAGLSLFLESGHSNTVTVVVVPEGIKDEEIIETMKADHNILIAGSFDVMAGKVIRLGHMGENARVDAMTGLLAALGETLKKLGFPVACPMDQAFLKDLL